MKKRILVTEDMISTRVLLQELFADHGFEVVGAAKNGNEAAILYKKFKPDVVTMDMVMPKSDGLQGLKEILAYDPQAKVVMISAINQDLAVQRALEIGAKGYVVKPYKEKDIIEILNRVLDED